MVPDNLDVNLLNLSALSRVRQDEVMNCESSILYGLMFSPYVIEFLTGVRKMPNNHIPLLFSGNDPTAVSTV